MDQEADGLPAPPWPGSACETAGDSRRWWFSDDPRDQAQARSRCVLCPVLSVCREWGRREPDGIWGGLTRVQRDLSGLTLPEVRWCQVCREQLPDRHLSSICGPSCYRSRSISTRKQARVETSASRACERCESSLWPQARSCLVCGHIVGQAIPNRPWPPGIRLVAS